MSPYLPSYSALMNHAHARAMVSMTRISAVATPPHHLPNAGTMRGGGCTAVSEEVSFPRALMHHDTHHVHGGTHLIDMSPYLPSHSALMHHVYAQGYLAHKKPPPRRALQQPCSWGPMVILGSQRAGNHPILHYRGTSLTRKRQPP